MTRQAMSLTIHESSQPDAVPAYVINVPVTVDPVLHRARRHHITSACEQTDTPFRFVNSVDGYRLTAEQRRVLTDEAAIARFPKWLTPGVVGCCLSHLQAYRDVISDNCNVAVILEDDVVLPPAFQPLLRECARLLGEAEVLLLEWRSPSGRPVSFSRIGSISLSSMSDCNLLYPSSLAPLAGATAYMVTRAACERLVSALTPVRACSDSWHWFYEWGAFGSLRCVVPPPVGPKADFKSTVRLHNGGVWTRAALLIARRRVWPLYAIFGFIRRRNRRRMQKYVLTNDRPFCWSP